MQEYAGNAITQLTTLLADYLTIFLNQQETTMLGRNQQTTPKPTPKPRTQVRRLLDNLAQAILDLKNGKPEAPERYGKAVGAAVTYLKTNDPLRESLDDLVTATMADDPNQTQLAREALGLEDPEGEKL
jgi:hypothetical protein